MRKRLRKKLRLGEFQELGFEVQFRLPENFNEAELDTFMDTFVIEAVEQNSLICGGGGKGHEWSFFVCRPDRKTSTEKDRFIIASFLENRGISDFHVGPLVDAWHD